MKLKSCYIENFGTLSQYSHEFVDGVNVVEEENGWGKTTLAAFLKAMLFGLEYTTARKYLVDRTRYIPWDGGKFGGNLVFEVRGKEYRVERYFGKRESDDTFTLYDLSTNRESKDFSRNIGEAVWNVDRDSYDKTAFITLKDVELLNDIISGRLGDIDEQEADMEASSKAIAVLEDEMKMLKSVRKTNGLINKKLSENHILKEELKKCEASLHLMEQYDVWLKEEETLLHKIEEESRELDKEQGKFVLYQKKKQLLDIVKELREAKESYENENNFFENKELDSIAIADIEQKVKAYEGLKLQSQIPSDAMSIEQEKMKVLSEKYDNVILSEEQLDGYIESYSRISSLQENQKKLEEELLKNENNKQVAEDKWKGKSGFGIWGVLGIFMIISGAAMSILMSVIGIGISVIGVVLTIYRLVNGHIVKNALMNSECDYLEKKRVLEQELENTIKEKQDIEYCCQEFLEKIKIQNSGNIMKELLNAKIEFTTYSQLKENIQFANEKYETKQQAVQENLRELEKAINEILALYFENHVLDYSVALDTIKSKGILCGEKAKRYNQVREKYEKFLEDNDVEALRTVIIPEQSEDELSILCIQKKRELTTRKIEIDQKIAGYIHDMNTAQIEIDKIVDIETSLERNAMEIEVMEQNHKLLSIAKKCMEESKETLATKYMSEMSTAFKKYLHLLGAKDANTYTIDTQLNVKIEHEGTLYESTRLSRGKQDLIQFCMRMALVDAIYKEVDTPILILDDPFVNLDERRVMSGVKLLKEIEKDYQLIYFVCHGSRA